MCERGYQTVGQREQERGDREMKRRRESEGVGQGVCVTKERRRETEGVRGREIERERKTERGGESERDGSSTSKSLLDRLPETQASLGI